MASKNEEAPEILKGVVVSESGQVKVWGHIGVKIPVPSMDYHMVEFSFGHERWAKNSTQEEIRKASVLVDEFNEAELDRRLRKVLRAIRRIDAEIEAEAQPAKAKKKGKKGKSALERAQSRLK